MSQTKVKSGLLNFPDQTDFVKLPSGTTAQRPSSPEEGYSRYNTTNDKLEYWNGTVWKQLPELDPPTLTSVDYPGNDLAADPAGGQTILINGTKFSAGISVEIGSTQVSSVTLNSTTQLAITSPALTAGDYDVTVTNLNATTITALDFISYNGVPSWVTSSGSLGSLNFGEAISTITLSATEPDGGNVSYAVTSGALPVGLSLSSSGDITGTMPSGSAETTYSFTVTATDDENQSTDRSFTITGVVPFLPSQHFNTVLYTGNGGTQSITGVGFQPDFTWIKVRTYPAGHNITDSVRGPYKVLSGLDTQAEINRTSYAGIASFDIDGFTVKDSSLGDYAFNGPPGGNYSGNGTYVSWNFKAGGAAVSTGGTNVTNRLVSANPAAGFSIMTYSGVNTDGTIEHGLNQAPEFWFFKNRTLSGKPWFTLTTAINGSVSYGYLNTTDAFASGAAQYVTNTVIGVNTDGGTGWLNQSGSNYVCYAFHSVAGFSKIGSYVGTGVVGNVSVVTGFEPAMIIAKRTDAGSSNWFIWDNKRDTINPNGTFLLPNAPNIEANLDAYGMNFLKNGFTVNSSDPQLNASGGSYIYMAFAADPNTQVPTKADSFNTVLHTPNNSGNDISLTGVNFAPDFVWMKYRYSTPATGQHYLFNSVTGDSILKSNANQAEISGGYIKSFDADGVTYLDTLINRTGTDSVVAWCWKAGGTPYINTDGSITSVVSANPAAGFSIVKFTGVASATVGHGLGTAPSVIIAKALNATNNWAVYHKDLGSSIALELNTTSASIPATNYWGTSGIPNSDVFGLWSNSGAGTTNGNTIAYCFAEVAGFSKFGSYDGGTITSSNIVNLGFRPAFVMLKPTQTTNDWIIYDNKRDTTDPLQHILYPVTSGAEQVSTNDDYNLYTTANGFYFNNTNGFINSSASDVIYMAFADQF
jgi:hypothetical protein